MFRCCSFLVSVFLALNVSGASANLTGDWSATIAGAQDTVTYLFKFDVKGDSFTGSVRIKNKKEESVGQITEGKIEGDKIAFTLHVPIAGTPSTVSANGTVTGNEKKLTIEGEDPHDGHRKMQLTLTRSAAN